jgi:cytosine/adenosine deaminase-related metal-dependent hydrolase
VSSQGLGKRVPDSPFYDRVRALVGDLGGLHNAHLHLCRVFTHDALAAAGASAGDVDSGHLALKQKHGLIRHLHETPDYAPAALRGRLDRAVEALVAAGTRVADTVIDTTDDAIGLSGLDVARACARDNADRLTLRLGAYNPLGFCDAEPGRWALFEQAAEQADFIGALPETDDRADYPDRIGFDESCLRVVDLARRLGKFAHVHLDQRNSPDEGATERFVQLLRGQGPLSMPDGTPLIWAIHVISPSTYDEARFRALLEEMKALNIGVVVCPSGALGMRQLRPQLTPTGNSIARVLEMLEIGLHVRLGCDNVADMLSPATTLDLMDEVYLLTAALRFYNIDILAHLAAGVPLDGERRAVVRAHLAQEREAIARSLSGG